MGKDDEDLLIKLIAGLFLLVLAIIVLIIIIAIVITFLVLAFIGLMTLKSWAYNTKWGKNNEKITSIRFDERTWEDLISPAVTPHSYLTKDYGKNLHFQASRPGAISGICRYGEGGQKDLSVL